MAVAAEPTDGGAERLLQALLEELKSPLLQISHQAELADNATLPTIQRVSNQALRLIDAYALSLEQQQLPLEPVSASSVLYEAAQILEPLAREHAGTVEVAIAGRYRPVMAHKQGLQAALVAMGQSLLAADTTPKPRLVLAAFKTRQGIMAGIFGRQPHLTPESWRRALDLYGRARQPLASSSGLNGAGLFVAHSLLEQMQASLEVSHFHKLTGLAVTLLPSAQLKLV